MYGKCARNITHVPEMCLVETCQVNGSSPFNVPDMFLPISRHLRPQCIGVRVWATDLHTRVDLGGHHLRAVIGEWGLEWAVPPRIRLIYILCSLTARVAGRFSV